MKTVIWILVAASAALVADNIAPPAATPPVKHESTIEEDSLRQLLGVRRIYVDRLTGGETAAQMRDLLLSSLESAKLFILTDNEQRADAFLRGGAEDLIFTDVHTSSDGVNARANIGTSRNARTIGSQSANAGFGVGENESSHVEERKHESVAAENGEGGRAQIGGRRSWSGSKMTVAERRRVTRVRRGIASPGR